jgi:hypothetical protein
MKLIRPIKKAKKLWSTENDGEEKVYSIAMGRVSELKESGNILACYGGTTKYLIF